MPTTYAHYTFGVEVYKKLNNDLKGLIYENIDAFNIGLHGPDILFYNGPLKSNRINETGNMLHKRNADIFFENARKTIKNCTEKNMAYAYIMGFICHFILDSECHPYIGKVEGESLTHNEIEMEFDRMLMVKNNIDPVSFKTTSHINPKLEYAKCISMFYDSINSDEILKSLKSMKFYLNFLVAPGKLKRSLIINCLKMTGNYNKMIGLIMSREPNPQCTEISLKLEEMLLKAIELAVEIINEYFENIDNEQPINSRFQRNFD